MKKSDLKTTSKNQSRWPVGIKQAEIGNKASEEFFSGFFAEHLMFSDSFDVPLCAIWKGLCYSVDMSLKYCLQKFKGVCSLYPGVPVLWNI